VLSPEYSVPVPDTRKKIKGTPKKGKPK